MEGSPFSHSGNTSTWIDSTGLNEYRLWISKPWIISEQLLVKWTHFTPVLILLACLTSVLTFHLLVTGKSRAQKWQINFPSLAFLGWQMPNSNGLVLQLYTIKGNSILLRLLIFHFFCVSKSCLSLLNSSFKFTFCWQEPQKWKWKQWWYITQQ